MKTHQIHDYRLAGMTVPRRRMTAFVDLDETLIHSVARPKARRRLIKVEDQTFGVYPRPMAHQLLAFLRAEFAQVRMLTMGIQVYANAMNTAFGLGFAAGEILAFEHVAYEMDREIYPISLTNHPGSLLIDNEHPRARNATLKRSWLGPSLYLEIRAFDGRPDPVGFSEHLLSSLRTV